MVNKKEKMLSEDITMLERYTQDLFSFTPLPLFFINPMGTILEVNPAFTGITGYDVYDIVGEPIFKLFIEESAEEIIKETMEKGFVKNRESVIISKEGEKIPVSIFTKNRKMSGKDSNGMFFSFFNLKEIKNKEKELNEKLEETERFRKLVVGRELKMLELKDRLRKLKRKKA